jgi:hypothetical protein
MRLMFLYTGVGSLLIFIGLIARYKQFKYDEDELKAIQDNFIEMKAASASNENSGIKEDINQTNNIVDEDDKRSIKNISFTSDNDFNDQASVNSYIKNIDNDKKSIYSRHSYTIKENNIIEEDKISVNSGKSIN